MNRASATRLGAAILILVVGVACGDGDGTTDPDTPTTGTIAVSAATAGDDQDTNGYSVMLDGTEVAAIGSNGSVNLTNVGAGSRSVSLSGVADNCSVGGEHPLSVTVTAGATAPAAFDVSCVAAVGGIEVSVTTTGEGTDADGYLVSVDGGAGEPIGVNQSLTLADVAVGSRLVELAEVAANCSVTSDNPQSAAVPLGGSVALSFAVGCVQPPPGTIAFISTRSGRAEIYLMDAAGGGLMQITDSAEEPNDAALSPDGTAVVYSAFGGADFDMWVVGSDGTNQIQLTTGDQGGDRWDWSPDGTQIVVDRWDSSGLYILESDGSSTVGLTDFGTFPAWSSNGVAIAFSGHETAPDTMSIYGVPATGGAVTRLSSGHQSDLLPRWSPDATQIAFDGNLGELWVMNADGTGGAQLAAAPGAGRLQWSPDGTRIAFVGGGTCDDAAQGVYVVNADGNNLLQLTTGLCADLGRSSPRMAWSPDGNWIVFGVWDGGADNDIYVVRADGSEEPIDVTNDTADNWSPSWAP